MFRAGPPGSPVSPNLAGRDAAAFALCFQVFAATDPELASRCLLAGEHIFELADTDPQGNLLTTIPFGFYPETEWRDDLELGATELSIALAGADTLPAGLPHTEARYYLEQAAHWAGAYIARSGSEGEGLNLYDVSGLADFELVRALREQGDPAGLAATEAGLIGDLAGKLQRARRAGARGPLRLRLPVGRIRHRLPRPGTVGDGLRVRRAGGRTHLRTFSERWLGNVLGANAWGSSFIIGDGTVFPDCPQHQVANLVGSLNGSPPVLAGAVVEGPSNETSPGKLPGMRPCPAGWRRRLRPLQQRLGVSRQRAVVHHHRARARPDGALDARLRLADNPTGGTRTGPMSDVTVVLDDQHLATVEIHRPPANYFDASLIGELADAYEALDADPNCRAIVLCSEGRHFCAGANLGSPGSPADEPRSLYRQALRLFASATPVVAAVQGAAVGGGLGLALSADFRVASPGSRFSANFSRLGFHHGFALTVTLPALAGNQTALDLLLTGRRVPGEEALALGLCDRLVEDGEVRAGAVALATELAGSAPLAVRSIRETLRGGLVERVESALEREATEQDRLRATADFREGVTASLERRTPRFQGT